MDTILSISPVYSQTQHIKDVLQPYGGQYQVIGTVDNSVLGMSLIEASRPDYVIMPAYMSFWNAEDLISHLLPRGITPAFIILHDGGHFRLEGTVAPQVSVVLPEEYPSEESLLMALRTAPVQFAPASIRSSGPPQYNATIQHSLEVMELLMGLVPLQTGEAQKHFGRLRVGDNDCWLLLGAPPATAGEQMNLFSQIENLEAVFSQLSVLLAPLGKNEVCVYRESNLCILLAGGQRREPDWPRLIQRVNQTLPRFGVSQMQFEISDAPLPLERWPGQCQELLRLRQIRFFCSPPCLQPKFRASYQLPVTQAQIHDKLSVLSIALHNRRRQEVSKTLRILEDMVSHSLSQDLYSFVTIQLAVQHSQMQYSYGLQDAGGDLAACFRQFDSVRAAFDFFDSVFASLCDRLGQVTGSANQIIADVCSYIEQNLSERLTLDVAARHAHVSATYLCRLFKRETGSSFNHYVSRRRIERAIQLLETPRRITDIAGMVGFDNAKYFSQVFKKQTGKTPQTYRLELRGEKEDVL